MLADRNKFHTILEVDAPEVSAWAISRVQLLVCLTRGSVRRDFGNDGEIEALGLQKVSKRLPVSVVQQG